jgi:hypothetical protein
MDLRVDAEGFLTLEEEGIDATLGKPLEVTLQDGLRITGVVQEPDSKPVTSFAVRAVRLRGLPNPSLAGVDLGDLQARLRDGNLDEATRTMLRDQLRVLRTQFENVGRGQGGERGGDRGGDRGRGRGDQGRRATMGRPEPHPGG